jgi:hypothetical protein
MKIPFEFTKAEVLTLCKESDYFLEMVVSRLEPVPTVSEEDQRFTKVARDAFLVGWANGGTIPAIKAVRNQAFVQNDQHKYYGLKSAKDFVERVCADLITAQRETDRRDKLYR